MPSAALPSSALDFDEATCGIGAYFIRAARAHPTRRFVDSPHHQLTFQEAAQLLAQIVESLHAQGLRRGDRVVCYANDQTSLIMFLLACMISGIQPCPVSTNFSIGYLERGVAQRLGARHVFTLPEHARALADCGLVAMCLGPHVPAHAVALTGPAAHCERQGATALAALASEAAEIRAHDVLLVAATSGSTGAPRLVVRRHLGPLRYARFVGDALRDSRAEIPRMLLVAALTHTFGLHMFATALRLGATLCVPTRIDTGASLAEIRALDPSVLPLVPRVQRALHHQALAADPTARIFGPSAEFICSAGGRANVEALARMQADGQQIVELYGSTEASLVTLTPPGAWHPNRGGKPVGDADVKIAADGEILVKSPGLLVEYLADPEATRGAMTIDGYFRMGDFGYFDADGYLRIAGRKALTFKLSEGSTFYPEHVEEMLEELPWVHQAILVGDDRPFLAAVLVVAPAAPAPTVPHDVAGPGALGYVPASDPRYAGAAAALAELNGRLERMERITRFALVTQPFAVAIYTYAGGGKVRRDPDALEAAFAPILRDLYAPLNGPGDPMRVPSPREDM